MIKLPNRSRRGRDGDPNNRRPIALKIAAVGLLLCGISLVRKDLLLNPASWSSSSCVTTTTTTTINGTTTTTTTTTVCSPTNTNRASLALEERGKDNNKDTTTTIEVAAPNTSNTPTIHNNNNNKTLVILMGNIRGGERAWQTLYKNVLDVNGADLALALGENKNRSSSLYGRAKYLWEFPEYEDWTHAVDEAMVLNNDTSWHEKLLDPMKTKGPSWQTNVFGGCAGYRGSGCVIFWIRWFISQKIKELGLLQKYDRLVLTRPDHFYLCPHDLSLLDASQTWVPSGQDWGGIMDRHLVAPADKFLDALDIYPPLVQNPDKYIDRVPVGAEVLIKLRFQEMGLRVQRFPTCFFTVAEEGDPTRYMKAKKTTEDGLRLKYPQEYHDSQETCSKRQQQ